MRKTISVRFLCGLVVMLALAACGGDRVVGALHDAGVDAPTRTGPYDECGNGMDDDGDGQIDEGCFCGGGETQPCFSGTYPNRGVGACADGVQTCDATSTMEFGHWGACTMDTLPADEACDGVDNDCDGAIDEGCPCTAGQTQGCGSEFAIAPCSAGTQTCGTDGTWSACEGAIGPSAEACGTGAGDGIDNDCDGLTDEGCSCVPEPEVCSDGVDNDCDGTVDEAACRINMTLPDACVAEPTEVCGDGVDNDCDGDIDELDCTIRGGLDGGTGADGGGTTDAGSESCTGVGEWTMRFPPEPTGEGSAIAEGHFIETDGDGILVGGQFYGSTLSLGSFTAVDGPHTSPGTSINEFVLKLNFDGSVRYAYSPTNRIHDDPSAAAWEDAPQIYIAGMTSDGRGGVWVSSTYRGVIGLSTTLSFQTLSPRSRSDYWYRNALLYHIDHDGHVVDGRSFGSDRQADAFGLLAHQGEKLIVAGTTARFFDMDGTTVAPPSAVTQWFVTLRPGSGSYAPERIDYFDPNAGDTSSLEPIIPVSNGSVVRYGISGRGQLAFGGASSGMSGKSINAIVTPRVGSLDSTVFVHTDGSSASITQMLIDRDNRSIIAGAVAGPVQFGGAALSPSGSYGGAYIAVLNPDGSHVWSRGIVQGINDGLHGVGRPLIAVDTSGNVYLILRVSGPIDIDFGAGVTTVPDRSFIFASYDSSGSLRWSRVEPQGDIVFFKDLTVDSCGVVYLTGKYRVSSFVHGAFVRRLMAP